MLSPHYKAPEIPKDEMMCPRSQSQQKIDLLFLPSTREVVIKSEIIINSQENEVKYFK